MFKPMTSYSLVGWSSEFILRLVIRKIQLINSDKGLYFSPTIFGFYGVESNIEFPSKNRIVISTIPRHDDRFLEVNIDDNCLNVFEFILEIKELENHSEYTAFFKKIFKNNHNIDSMFYTYLLISDTAIIENKFRVEIAEQIYHKKFKLDFSYSDSVLSLVNYINCLDMSSFKQLQKVYNRPDKFPLLISNLGKITDMSLPDYLMEKCSHFLNSVQFIKNMLNISVKLLAVSSYETAMLILMRSIK